MIAARIGPDVRFAVVGAKSFFAERAPPREPQELIQHNCINLRLPTYRGTYAWECEKDGRELKVRVDGQLIFNSVFQILHACVAGFGLAFLPEDIVEPHLAAGRLQRALDDWCQPWADYHLYYPHRSESSPAFALLLEALRHEQP